MVYDGVMMITVNFRCRVCHHYDDYCRGHKMPWNPGWWIAAGHKKFEVLSPCSSMDEQECSKLTDAGSNPARGAIMRRCYVDNFPQQTVKLVGGMTRHTAGTARLLDEVLRS